MKRFKFRLETVLRVKGRLEELRRMELTEVECRRDQARMEFNQRQHEVDEVIGVCRVQMQRKFDPYLAKDYFHYISRLNGLVKEALNLLEQSEAAVLEARNKLIEAAREKKTLEKLKEHAYQTYCAEELQAEINFLDELGTTRFVRRQEFNKDGSL